MTTNSTIETTNGFTLVGPSENLKEAKELVKIMGKEMNSVYKEELDHVGESLAMDARDDVFWNDYEEKFKTLGYLYTETED